MRQNNSQVSRQNYTNYFDISAPDIFLDFRYFRRQRKYPNATGVEKGAEFRTLPPYKMASQCFVFDVGL